MQQVTGIVQPGYRVASGLADDSPYPAGTIALQMTHFQRLGLDLRDCYPGTLNVNIAPMRFQLLQPAYTFPDLVWIEGFERETFSFCHCEIQFNQQSYSGWIYYPHPETKIGHHQPSTLVEVLAPRIAGIEYGDRVVLVGRSAEIRWMQFQW
jgi:CTP-dependent riboflavin kinase